MLRIILLSLIAALTQRIAAQPDSLYVPEHNGVVAYAVTYAPLQQVEQYVRIGRFVQDTSRIAVRLYYKHGKPCGTYRAYYPDGRPLIFAVYGWGRLEGDWTEYAPDGRITVKGQYSDGLRDGTWAFREQGIVGHYSDGKKNGKWKYYENDRLVRVERYRKDVLLTGSRFLFK